jgi:phosphatidylinositol alpha-mannosyltransferase
MRVALACPYAWDEPGGVQTHVRELAAELRRRHHDVMVLAPSRRPLLDHGVRRVGTAVGVPFNGAVAPICPDPRSRRHIASELASFGPNVVHVHEPFAPSTGLFATLAATAPVVATFHAYAERGLMVRGLAPLLRRISRRVAVPVAVSRAAAHFAAPAVRAPIVVIPNGIDVERFAGAAPAELPAGRRILFVGRVDEERKGFPVLARAFARLAAQVADALLVVVGPGSGRASPQDLPVRLRHRVLEFGRVTDDELPRYHAAADVFVAPALRGESFGLVVVEAMAAGVPVVASDIPGYRDVVAAGSNGLLVPPGDPDALAGAIRRVLLDAPLAERLAQAGRRDVDRYRWESVTDRLEEVYRDAMRAGAGDRFAR